MAQHIMAFTYLFYRYSDLAPKSCYWSLQCLVPPILGHTFSQWPLGCPVLSLQGQPQGSRGAWLGGGRSLALCSLKGPGQEDYCKFPKAAEATPM